MEKGEPILLICHGFPPVRGVGGRRWAKFAKELARRGHAVHVVRSTPHPGSPPSLWSVDAQHPGIIHHPLPRRYPRILAKRPLNAWTEKLQYRFWRAVLPWFTRGNWHDATAFWRKQMLAEAGTLIRRHGIRQMIATGAPFRLLVFGAELKERFPQINLVVDFRDEWTWKGHYGLANMGPQRQQLEQEMEARVIRAADQVITPHPAIVRHLAAQFPECAAKLVVVPHAVDPEDFSLPAEPVRGGPFRMIYAGSLYGADEARTYVEQLLQAVGKLQADGQASVQVDLYITGHDTRWVRDLVIAQNLSGQVHIHAPLPPKEIFKQIRESNLVVLFIPTGNKDILGTKFEEVFFSGTPILHVGDPGLVSRTIRTRHMGDSIRVQDLVEELPRIITGRRKVECDRSADHSAYLLPSVTGRLINEVLV